MLRISQYWRPLRYSTSKIRRLPCRLSTANSSETSTEDRKLTNIGQGSNEYDVIIVGGGLVGAAVGCGLANLPLTKTLRVAIIDSNPNLHASSNPEKDGVPDARVSSITPSTIAFFQDVGAWDRVQKCRHAPFDKMQVWDYTGWGYTRYNAKDVGKGVLGYVVENKVLHNALLSSLQDANFAEILAPVKVKSIVPKRRLTPSSQPNPHEEIANDKLSAGLNVASKGVSACIASQHFATVELSDGNCLYARLVVGADGGRSQVRSLLGFQTTGWEYKQEALICTVEVESKTTTAWQRFLPTGPLALLPMGEKFCNIVWSTTPEKAKALKDMSADDFIHSVNNALKHDYGENPNSQFSELIQRIKWLSGELTPSTLEPFEPPPTVIGLSTERLSFPLALTHAKEYALDRAVLVGDAAHTVHPLAGQGVNLGFGDAVTLARILNRGLSTGSDIGEMPLLKRYERERKSANLPMMAVLDGFQKIFSANIIPVNLFRAAAFNGVQLFGPLKRQIISYAMGEQKLPFPLSAFGAVSSP